MADLGVKMNVTGVAQFKQAMAQSTANVKALDSALKLNEKQFKATGDSEKYMQEKTTLLTQKLEAQKKTIKEAENALKALKESGVDQASAAFQDMQRKLLDAQSAMMDTQSEIANIGNESTEAAGKADQLTSSLAGLNKKVSLEQVIGVVNSLTGALQNAGRIAVDVGKQIWENITDAAQYSDDIATQAMMLNMDPEQFQKMKNVFDTYGEMTVQEWRKAQQKVKKAVNDPSQDQVDILEALGISTHETEFTEKGIVQGAARDAVEVFWEIGETIRRQVKNGELSQDMADLYGEVFYGKGFAAFNPMMEMGQEAFEALVESQTVATKHAIEANATLNDKLNELIQNYEELKVEIIGGLAPELTKAADALNGMLTSIMDYLQKPEGKQALEDMGKAVGTLFEDLGKIDPEQVVQNFSTLFTTIIEKFQWLADNWGSVTTGLRAIADAFGLMKVASSVLTFFKLVQGAKGLFGRGSGGGGSAAAEAAGAAGGGLITSLQNAITGAAAKVGSAWASGGWSMTAGPYMDWFMNQTDIGRFLRGEETWDDVLKSVEKFGDSIKENAETFEEDWANNPIVKFFRERFETNGKNAMALWDSIFNQKQKPVAVIEIEEDEDLDNSGPYFNLKKEQWEAAEKYWDTIRENGFMSDKTINELIELEELFRDSNEELDKYTLLVDMLNSMWRNGTYTGEDLPEHWKGEAEQWLEDEKIEFPAEPEMAPDSQELLQAGLDLLTLKLPVTPYLTSDDWLPFYPHANGIDYVPFDGYPALLHKGERVMSAREVNESRNFSSNLYIESMYMNSGTDAEGLAAAMAAAQRRTMAGFGS